MSTHIKAGIAVLMPRSKRWLPKVKSKLIAHTIPKIVRFFFEINRSRPCAKPIKKEGIAAALRTDKPAKANKLKLNSWLEIICDKAGKEASDKVKDTIPNHKVAPNTDCQAGKNENSTIKTPITAKMNPMISGVASRVSA